MSAKRLNTKNSRMKDVDMETNPKQFDDSKRIFIFYSIPFILIVVAVYARMMSSSFISFDDSVYVVDNPFINQGLTWEGIKAVFDLHQKTGPYWHPVTSLSHMIDCTLFGLNPAMHHLTNMILHGLNAFLLASLLYLATGDRVKSYWVAAIFALHPLNVETVAWVSERKNLLATLFFLLGLVAYIRFVKKRTVGAYVLLVVIFVLGLMSKPTMMTFPFTLFLFLFWPLNGYEFNASSSPVRFFKRNTGHIYPVLGMIALLLVMFIVVFFMGGNQSNQASFQYIPLSLRVSNMLVADVTYLGNLVFPVNLTIFHPYPESIPVFKAIVAFIILLAVSVMACVHARKWPFVFMGWFWYVGNLVTASGLLQQGYFPAHADRFTYLPMIGIFILIAWGVPRVFEQWQMNGKILGYAAFGLIFIFSVLTFNQTKHWENGITLFSHAVELNPDDVVSTTNLALALGESGQLDEAIKVSRKALDLEPDYAEALNNMGTLYAKKGDVISAVPFFDRALEVYPGFKLARENRDMAIKTLASYVVNENELRKALSEHSDFLKTASILAKVLVVQKNYAKAESIYLAILDTYPESGASISYNLACLHAQAGDTGKAMTWLETSFQKGFNAWRLLDKDPDMESLRGRDDYHALIDLYRDGKTN